MILSERAKGLLRCPICNAGIRIDDENARCSAQSCLAVFPIVNGIPVLLNEQESILSLRDYEAPKSSPSSSTVRLKRLGHRVLPTLDLNVSGVKNIETFADLLFARTKTPIVLNVGGKHPGSVTSRLCMNAGVDCIECDVSFKERTNLIAESHKLPLADASVDAVLIDGVLEHVLDPVSSVREAFRVLKEDGLVYSDTPFMLQVHGGGIDFLRFSHLGHRRLFRNFEEISSGITSGPGVALSYSIQYFMLSFVRSQAARFAVKGVCRLALFWLKYFDFYLVSQPGSLDAAHGFYFMGRKSRVVLSDSDLINGYRGITPALYPTRRADQR